MEAGGGAGDASFRNGEVVVRKAAEGKKGGRWIMKAGCPRKCFKMLRITQEKERRRVPMLQAVCGGGQPGERDVVET